MRFSIRMLLILFLCCLGSRAAIARDIRLFDQTGNDAWVVELDLKPATQQAYSMRNRDAQNLPKPVQLASVLYLAEWGKYTPGVPFQEQAKTSSHVFECKLNATTDNYKIIKQADGNFKCQGAVLGRIERLTVKIKAAGPTLAALVDYKPVSANRDTAVVSVNTLDHFVQVSDWQQTRSRQCPVQNDSISIVISSYTAVECGDTTPPPSPAFAKLKIRLEADSSGELPRQKPSVPLVITSVGTPPSTRTVSLAWNGDLLVEKLNVGEATVQVEPITLAGGRTFLPNYSPGNKLDLKKDETAALRITFTEQQTARQDIHVKLVAAPYAGAPATIDLTLMEGTTALATKKASWDGQVTFPAYQAGHTYRLVAPKLTKEGASYEPILKRNDAAGAVITEFTLQANEPSRLFIDYLRPPVDDKKVIGYYESWSQWRTNLDSGYKSALVPSEINPNLLTHLVFAFGSFGFEIFDRDANGQVIAKRPHNTGDYRVYPWEDNDTTRLRELVALKQVNPKLKIIYGLGGWNFNMPASAAGPYIYSDRTNYLFSDMISNTTKAHKEPTPANEKVSCAGLSIDKGDCVLIKDDAGNPTTSRKQFIAALIKFLRAHQLDGFDFDWEYPGVLSRGGNCNDFPNMVAFLRELRSAFVSEALASGKERLSLSLALPAGLPADVCPAYATEKAYMAEMAKWHDEADWIGMMTYDFYGSWGNEVAPNAPLNPVISKRTGKEIITGFNVQATIQRYLNAGMSAHKIMMGMGTYGRNFSQVQFAGNDYSPGALTATGQGFPGESTAEFGLSTYFELVDLIKNHGFTKAYDSKTETPYAYNQALKQWVGFDDPASLALKCNAILSHELGGTIVWSITNDDHQGASGSRFPLLNTIHQCLRSARMEP